MIVSETKTFIKTVLAVTVVAVVNIYFLPALLGATIVGVGFDLMLLVHESLGVENKLLMTYVLPPILVFGFSFLLALPIILVLRVFSMRVAIVCALAAILGRHLIFDYVHSSIFWIGEDVALLLGICAATALLRAMRGRVRPADSKK